MADEERILFSGVATGVGPGSQWVWGEQTTFSQWLKASEATTERINKLCGEHYPSGLMNHPGSQQIGFIGMQLLPYFQTAEFELTFYHVADFRYVYLRKLTETIQTPPPRVYEGAWSHMLVTALKVDQLALYFVDKLSDDEMRDAVMNWENKIKDVDQSLGSWTGPFWGNTFPLKNYRLTVRMKWKIEDDYREVVVPHDGLSLHIPHLLKRVVPDDQNYIVCSLPSLFTLRSANTRTYKSDESSSQKFNSSQEQYSKNKKNDHFIDMFDGITNEILLASPHVRKAISSVAEVWKDNSIRNTLLIAPPGSGKQVLAEFLHAGCLRFRPGRTKIVERSANLTSVQLGGVKETELRERLFGELDKSKDDQSCQQDEEEINGTFWRGGAVLKAHGTVLFIDEIDKCGSKERGFLLRFLENDEVFPKNGAPFLLGKGEATKLKGYKCLRLFAGSKLRKEMFELPPPDFWTRIQHVIEMTHPLEIHSEDERVQCLQEYVLLFLYRHVEKKLEEWFEINGTQEKQRQEKEKLEALVNALRSMLNGTSHQRPASASTTDDHNNPFEKLIDLLKQHPGLLDQYPWTYLDGKYAYRLSLFISQFLIRFPTSRLSVRNLKSLMKRLDSRIECWLKSGLDIMDAKSRMFHDPENWLTKELKELEKMITNSSWNDELEQKVKSIIAFQQEGRDRHKDRLWIWANLHQIAIEVF